MAIRSKAPSSRTCCRFSKFLSAGFAPRIPCCSGTTVAFEELVALEDLVALEELGPYLWRSCSSHFGSGQRRADALRLHLRRAVALAPVAGGLAGGAGAGAAVDAGAGRVLCRTARRLAQRDRGRTRVPARHLSRAAARVLARRARLRSRRPQRGRCLPALAGMRCRHLLGRVHARQRDRKSTRLNSSLVAISYAVFCLKKKKKTKTHKKMKKKKKRKTKKNI